jgi:hypothetical protein
MSQIMFETDYPHGDSTFPHSKDTTAAIVSKAGLSEQEPARQRDLVLPAGPLRHHQ